MPERTTDVPGLDQAVVDEMITARRHLHAHPELSNEERETQAFISNWLCERGLTPRTVAGTGIPGFSI